MVRSAQIRLLQVRPSRSADLSFETGGRLTGRNGVLIPLGTLIEGFDSQAFNHRIAGAWTVYEQNLADQVPMDSVEEAGAKASLFFRPERIDAHLEPFVLARLENAHFSARANHFLAARQTSFLKGYTSSETASNIASYHVARLKTLEDLQAALTKRFDSLMDAYNSAPVGVVKNVTVVNEPSGKIATNTYAISVGSQTSSPTVETTFEYNGSSNSDALSSTLQSPQGKTVTVPVHFEGGQWVPINYQNDTIYKTGVIEVDYHPNRNYKQTSTTHSGHYSNPSKEMQIQYFEKSLAVERELIEARLNVERANWSFPIWVNEGKMLTTDAVMAQLDYSRTLLTSPFSGRVTAVYKSAGEVVRAGEPIVRIENDETLLLVGRVQYRGILRVGNLGTLTLAKFAEGESAVDLGQVNVLSVRGHNVDNDEWDVILQCANPTDSDGKRVVPINYQIAGKDGALAFE